MFARARSRGYLKRATNAPCHFPSGNWMPPRVECFVSIAGSGVCDAIRMYLREPLDRGMETLRCGGDLGRADSGRARGRYEADPGIRDAPGDLDHPR